MRSVSEVFLKAAEAIAEGYETFSCNAIGRKKFGLAGSQASRIYKDTISDEEGYVRVSLFTVDKGKYVSEETSRDLRVLMLCMMAAMTAPHKRK